MRDPTKRKALLFFLMALIALLVAGWSLHGLRLQPGLPLPGVENPNSDQTTSFFHIQYTASDLATKVILGILGVAFLVFFPYILVKFSRQADMRKLFGSLGLLILLLALIVFLPLIGIGSPGPAGTEMVQETPLPTSAYTGGPLGTPSLAFLWIVFGILGAGLVVVLGWVFLRQRDARGTRDRILQEAQKAVEDLQMGGDFRSVILRCYRQMTHVLKEEQGIERDANLTAREFMDLLQKRGISPAPVRTLTLLFEAARYSPLEPSGKDEQAGLECLNEIIRDSRRSEG